MKLLIIFLILFSCEEVFATECTDKTLKACVATKHVTGECVDDVCECSEGFIPADSGCIEPYTPEASVEEPYSGEAIAGSGVEVNLLCSLELGDGNYLWYKGTEELDGTNEILTISAETPQPSAEYTCKGNQNGYTTAASNAVTVVIHASDGVVTLKPVISGMPGGSFPTIIDFKARNIPATPNSLQFSWYLGSTSGTILSTQQNYILTEFSSTHAGQNIVLQISPSILDSFTISNDESDPVAFPATVATDVDEVYIVQESFEVFAFGSYELNCRITNAENFNYRINFPEITWYFDQSETPIAGKVSVRIVDNARPDHAGKWECGAKYSTGILKKSEPITLSVVDNAFLKLLRIVSTPLIGSCLYAFCSISYRDLDSLKFIWKLDGNVIHNHHDQLLQFCPAKAGRLACSAKTTSADTSSTFQSVIPEPVLISSDTLDFEIISNKGDEEEYAVGSTYIFTCDASNFLTPGLTYSWKEDGEPIDETGSTLSVTLVGEEKTLACKTSFNGIDSIETELVISAEDQKQIRSVTLGLNAYVGSVLATESSYGPLENSEMTFKCIVDLVEDASGEPTYVWKNGDTPYNGETSETYTVTVGADAIELSCEVTLDGFTKASKKIDLAKDDTFSIVAVKVFVSDGTELHSGAVLSSGELDLSEGASYTFACLTPSYSDSLTFEWSIDGEVQSSTLPYLQRSNMEQSDEAQEISCQISVAGQSPITDTINIKVGEQGRSCYSVVDCYFDGYAETCTESRCDCAENFIVVGDACVSDDDDGGDDSKADKIMAPVLLTLSALILRFLFLG